MNNVDVAELERTASRRINVGSGDWPFTYFTNIDADPSKAAEIHCTVPPLPQADNSADIVWAGHFLEHLDYEQALEFMREAYRVLTPGGMLGIVVPDTREVMRRWLAGAIDAVEYPMQQWHDIRDLKTICRVFLYSSVQDSPHRWAWDEWTLSEAMESAGFVNLKRVDRYRHRFIVMGAWYQCGYEGYKP